MIPSKLRDDINFVLLKAKDKIPFEKEWTKKEIKWDDDRLVEHISNGGNYGVMGGMIEEERGLIIVDFDDADVQAEAIKKLPTTFTVKTGSGLLHKYFFSNKANSYKILKEDKSTIADIQGQGKQVVGPGSTHPNGNKYTIEDNSKIEFIDYDELKDLMNSFNVKAEKKIEPTQPVLSNYTSDIVEDIKARVKIKDLLNEFGIDTTKNPTNCPFHDSKGEKCLGFEDDRAHCFHCDDAWNIFSLVKQYKNYDFKEALEWLCDREGMTDELNQSRIDWGKLQEPVVQQQEKETPTDNEINLIWDNDLANYEIEDKEWLVDGLIPAGGIGVWTGKRGSFKTFLLMNAAYCIASGKKFLNKYDTKQGKVIYLDKENGIPIMKERSGMIKTGLSLEKADIGYICFSQLKLDKNTDMWAIEELIEKEKPAMLVIDTYRRAISFDENSAGDVSRLFVDILRPIVDKHWPLSIVLIHHDRKGSGQGDEMDEIRGSSDLANYCDFILKNCRKGNKLELRQLKNRNAPELEPIPISINTDEKTTMEFSCSSTPLVKTQLERCNELILLWMAKKQVSEFSTAQVKEIANNAGIKTTNFKESLNDLQSLGVVEKSTKGKYKVIKDVGGGFGS